MFWIVLLTACASDPVGADSADSPCEQGCYALREGCSEEVWSNYLATSGVSEGAPYAACVAECETGGAQWGECLSTVTGWPDQFDVQSCNSIFYTCGPLPCWKGEADCP